MKKLLLMIFIFFMPLAVSANELDKDIYLEEIVVNGYDISPAYEKFNNIYTLIIHDQIDWIEVTFIKENENDIVEVNGTTYLREGENEVTVIVKNKEGTKENTYAIIVTIDSGTMNTLATIINNYDIPKEIGIIDVSTIIGVCFLVIMFVHKIIYRSNKKVIITKS